MLQWEYRVLTIRIVQTTGKTPGFFNRYEMQREIAHESQEEISDFGRQGWELVSVVHLDPPTRDGVNSAAAIFKRPLA